ncbi:hypothetical protein THOB06_10297 [Vibrio rotiferianus]|nr:hypothetical protein THOG10_10297 [Vibrio rotiferianus]CAH1556864.1 hypothetical protein THOB06_10297 [Vibrio rotiferianus]
MLLPKNNNAALDAALKAGDGFDYLVATAAQLNRLVRSVGLDHNTTVSSVVSTFKR